MTRRSGPTSATATAGKLAPELAIVGSFSLDSVVTPDGRALPAKPGGNALWSAMGAYLAGHRPGIVARVGTDYPTAVLDRLADAGFDLSSLVRLPRAHPVRVSYAHLPNGERVQPVPNALIAHLTAQERAEFVDTTGAPETLIEGAPTPEDIPAHWLSGTGYWHLPLLPLARHRALVAALSAGTGRLHADCPTRQELTGAPFERLRQSLPHIDVFLPSTSDFDVVAPQMSPRDALRALRLHGARDMVLKAGPDGAYVLDGNRLLQISAHASPPIDPTGAGDAFCGGFLVARARGDNMLEAAALGSACASFALETPNPLDLLDLDPVAVIWRAEALLDTAKLITAAFDLSPTQPGTPALTKDQLL